MNLEVGSWKDDTVKLEKEIASRDNNNIKRSPVMVQQESQNSRSVQTGISPATDTIEAKQCAGCAQLIQDRFLLKSLERFWHQTCLKCHCCSKPLGNLGSTCFAKGGMVLCRQDYIRLFGSRGKCTNCQQQIPASEFVMKVQGEVYHMQCFCCSACHVRLHPGDRYSIINGRLLCEHDYPKVLKSQLQLEIYAHKA